MYELIILSLLMRAPMHGYLLAKIINDKIGPWARLSNGTLYPLLARLERDGSITTAPAAEGSDQEAGAPHATGAQETDAEGAQGAADRTCRRYAITAKGERRFHALMLDTTANTSDYQRIFRQKVSSFPLLPAAERNYLLDHYLSYCETTILHYEREARDLERKLSAPDMGVPDMDATAPPREDVSIRAAALEATILVLGRQAEEWRAELAWAQRLRDRTWPGDIAHLLTTTSMRPAAHRGRFPRKRGSAGDERDSGQVQDVATHQGGEHHANA